MPCSPTRLTKRLPFYMKIMTRSIIASATHLLRLSLVLLASMAAEAWGQGLQSTTQVVGKLVSVDAERSQVRFSAMGGEWGLPVAEQARLLDEDGQPLTARLASERLAAGVILTVTIAEVDAAPSVLALRIGRHIPEQRREHGPAVGLTPLTEFGEDQTYAGESGGLYSRGMNIPPPAHRAAAESAIKRITPLDTAGGPARDGVIGFVSISMSNATMEFSTFKRLADQDDRKLSSVAIVDCAQNGMAMAQWANPNATPWLEADRRLEAAGVSPMQVQVVWVKLANMGPTGDLDHHGRKLYDDTLAVLQNAKKRFANLRVAYLGSRIFAGFAPEGEGGTLNPEPYAYEGAFAVRWLIRDQMKHDDVLRHDGENAPVPLLLWGPYLWADGTTPRRSDGLTWRRGDLTEDGVHPTDTGQRKVADLLLAFFSSDPLAKQWFTVPSAR